MSMAVIVPKRWIPWPLLLLTVAALSGAAKPAPAVKPSNLGIILFVVALLIGIPMAYRLWRDTHQEDDSSPQSGMLSDFEQAYAAGQMNEAEIRRIRRLMIDPKWMSSEKTLTKSGGVELASPPLESPDPPTTPQTEPTPSLDPQ